MIESFINNITHVVYVIPVIIKYSNIHNCNVNI